MKIPENMFKIIGNKIKYIRNSKGLSQNRLAKKIGSSRVYISRIESGKVIFSTDVVRKIAKVLKVPFDSLFNQEYLVERVTVTDEFLTKRLYFPGGFARLWWTFGFIFGDASLRDTTLPYQLIIKHSHPEPLENIKSALRLPNLVGYYKKKGLYHLAFTDSIIINYLRYGLGFIKPREKRLFPDISDKYVSHFIGGFFDAHGCAIPDKLRKRLVVSLSYQSEEFMKSIVDILFRNKIVIRKNPVLPLRIYKDKRSTHYVIKILGTSNIGRFFSYVYTDSNSRMCDEKKRKDFCKKLEKFA